MRYLSQYAIACRGWWLPSGLWSHVAPPARQKPPLKWVLQVGWTAIRDALFPLRGFNKLEALE